METPTETGTQAAEREELKKVIADFKTAMLVTRGPDGHFHARPMALQHHGPNDGLWFCTSMDSEKIRDLQADPHCAVALHDADRSATYVSLSGTAEVVQDRQLIHELWRPDWKAWFPEGPDTPDLTLLRFRPEHAEYVHPEGGRAKVLLTMIGRVISGKRADPAKKHEVDLH